MAEHSGTGVLLVLGAMTFGVVLVGCLLYVRDLRLGAVRVGRRLHLLPTPPARPEGQPLERIAADLRRLRPQARLHPEGAAYARHRGVVAAYDEALRDACRALSVPTDLADLPEGLEREAERIRVEYALEAAGLPLSRAS